MTDEIERLKQQHREELDLAQEVIVNLRRDLAHAHKRIHSQDAVWNDALAAASSYMIKRSMQGRGLEASACYRNAAAAIERLKRPIA